VLPTKELTGGNDFAEQKKPNPYEPSQEGDWMKTSRKIEEAKRRNGNRFGRSFGLLDPQSEGVPDYNRLFKEFGPFAERYKADFAAKQAQTPQGQDSGRPVCAYMAAAR